MLVFSSKKKKKMMASSPEGNLKDVSKEFFACCLSSSTLQCTVGVLSHNFV
jgi:hypothetical protein